MRTRMDTHMHTRVQGDHACAYVYIVNFAHFYNLSVLYPDVPMGEVLIESTASASDTQAPEETASVTLATPALVDRSSLFYLG